jgi:hypothetical protein
VESALDFDWVGAFEKEVDSFFEVGCGGFEVSPWLATFNSGHSAT